MSAAGPAPTRSEAKIALLGVDDATGSVLAGCFRQFGIDTVAAGGWSEVRGHVAACVVPLDKHAEPVLKAIREASHRTVIYGACDSVREAMQFSAYGINAVFQTPIQIQDALQVVRATHLLVLKELRRFVRVPLVSLVQLETGTEELHGSSVELSEGGMSLVTDGHLVVPQTVLAKFTLPGGRAVQTRAVVCWTRHAEGLAAIRFDPSDPRRAVITEWIDEYLG